MDDRPRALIIDDYPDIAEMLAQVISRAGFQTEVAHSATEALKAANELRFDLILSDIGLPEMNGYELAEELRKLPQYRNVPMISISGFHMYADRERALQAGFNAHLVKPVSPPALLELVSRLQRQMNWKKV